MNIHRNFKRDVTNYALPGSRFGGLRTCVEDARVAGMEFLRRRQKAFGNVCVWLLFCVIVAFIPVGVRWMVDRAMNEPFIWDNGELLAVSTGLLGDSVAVLWISRTIAVNFTNVGRRWLRGVLSVGAGIVFGVLVLFLTLLAAHPRSPNENFITLASCLLFVFTVLVGIVCKWMEG